MLKHKSVKTSLVFAMTFVFLSANLFFLPRIFNSESSFQNIFSSLNGFNSKKLTPSVQAVTELTSTVDPIYQEILNLELVSQQISQIFDPMDSRNYNKHDLSDKLDDLTKNKLTKELERLLSLLKYTLRINKVSTIIQKISESENSTEIVFENNENSRADIKQGIDETKRGLNNIFVLNLGIKSCSATQIETQEATSVFSNRNASRGAILYTETSGLGRIRSRFVCAIESAARVYPDHDIYLVITSIPKTGLLVEFNQALHLILKHHKNIQVLHVNMNKLFMGSPLEIFYKSGKLFKGKYVKNNISNVLRILIIWKYGGTYFDLDIISIKKLVDNKNIVFFESAYVGLTNSAFRFEKSHTVLSRVLEKLNSSFNGDIWGNNGPVMLSQAMKNFSGRGISKVDTIKDVKMLRYYSLCPIDYLQLYKYFDEKESEILMMTLEYLERDIYGLHISNKIVKHDTVYIGSKQAYGLLAQKYCPRSYWCNEKTF